MKTLKDFDVSQKRILVRCDFNVPMDEKGNILDDFRIRKTLPTIKYLIERKAKIILMSHLGDPKGQVVPELKMDKIAERLAEYLNFTVEKEDECVGLEVEEQSNQLKPGKVLLLENLRFHKEEVDNDPEFAKKLSYLGDIYVNDGFGVCHRDQASVTGVPKLLPNCAGLLLEQEMIALNKIMQNPAKPMISLVGGTKVSTKAAFIENISKTSDFVLVSGLIAKEISEKNTEFSQPEKIIGPAGTFNGFDISDEAIKVFSEKIMQAKTVLWNGPFGKFEDAEYAKGTLALARAIVDSGAFSVVGGGETVEFIEKQGMIDKFSHVSTGGGAMLNYLSGDSLPGIVALG